MPHQAQLHVQTDLYELAGQVLPWFDQLYQSSIPSGVWLRCKLALAEAFSNAVRHAHQGLPVETLINVEVSVYEEYLELRVWDYGPPFDFDQKLQEELAVHNLEGGGGRGIKLIYDIADELSYTRIDNQRNCLLLRKYYVFEEHPAPTLENSHG